jgi:hypothetical protein
MHSKHAEPVASVTTGPTQPPPATSEPPRVDSVETEEGWKKVERKRWKGKREKKVGTRSAGGVPTCAAIAQGGGVSVNVFIGAGAERGRRSSKGIRFFFDGRMKGRNGRFFLSCVLFVSFV